MTKIELELELLRVAQALGRRIQQQGGQRAAVRVVQVCPACGAELGIWIDVGASTLQHQLFAFYDQHSCKPESDGLFEAAEREMLRAAERIPAITDPELRARAELESDRMAAIVDRLRKRFGG